MQFCSETAPNYNDRTGAFPGANSSNHFDPIHIGQVKLGQNHRWAKYFGLHYCRSGRRYFAQKVIAG